MLLSLFLLAACDGAGRSAAFIVTGSTSVQSYVEILAEKYELAHPGISIDVQGGGSSAGIQAVESDTAEIGMSSRNLRENELHLWSIEITKDGLAIIVNPNNPVGNLTVDQIQGIYSTKYTNWSEVGGPDARIHIITREEGSGTRGAFEDMVMSDVRITPRAIVQNSNGAVRQLVSGDQFSIGYISLGLVDDGESPVKAVAIEGVEPTPDNVRKGDYVLFRSFLFVAKEEPSGDVMEFIEYILSPEGRRILENEGLIPSPPEE